MLYVALGRNVGDEPMSDTDWFRFRKRVVDTIGNWENIPDPDTSAWGNSTWAGDFEETAVYIWFEKMSPLSNETLVALADIAKAFGQEAIAYTVAPTWFVEAN